MTRTTASRAVATALALAGCSAGEQRREVDAAPAKIVGREASRQDGLLSGTWSPLPGRIVDIAATDDMLFLADVSEAGHPMRVHAGRWRDGQWRWEQPWSVPRPPTVPADHDLAGTGAWLGVAAIPGGAHVSLSRIEYQGGSHGVALASLIDGAWTNTAEIASTTDADIEFGRPALRRGDVLLTADGHDRLWHYTRAGNNHWQGKPIALPPGATLLSEPAMDLSADAGQLVVAYLDTAAKKPALALYRREPTGSYALAGTRALPGPVTALAFGGAELFIAFQRPVEDGALVWALPPAWPDPLVPARRFEFPAPADPKQEHLAGGDVSPAWVLALQLDAAYVRDGAAAGPARRLDLPPAKDGKPRRPAGALVGSIAVLLVDGRLGAFALE